MWQDAGDGYLLAGSLPGSRVHALKDPPQGLIKFVQRGESLEP